MDMHSVALALRGVNIKVYEGYPETGAKSPYVVVRPMSLEESLDGGAICGDAISWDNRIALYCRAGSVQASHNLALDAMRTLHGRYMDETTMTASLGYVGAVVEGQYESQITLFTAQGVI